MQRRGRDLNPRRTFQHVRDFQSRSLGRSDTSPRSQRLPAGRPGSAACCGRDVGGDVLDLLLAQRVRERRHAALAVRHAVDGDLVRGHRRVEVGPIVPVAPASESVWQPPHACGAEEDLLARGRIALATSPRAPWSWSRPAASSVGSVSAGRLDSVAPARTGRLVRLGLLVAEVAVHHHRGAAARRRGRAQIATKIPRLLPGKAGRERGMTSAQTSANTMKTAATTSRSPSRSRSAPAARA